MESFCSSEFAFWVQFTLFDQLALAYARILELGFQLVIGFSAAGDFGVVVSAPNAMLHYSQAIHLAGMDNFCEPLRREVFETLFGTHVAVVVLMLCEEGPGGFSIPEGNRRPAKLAEVLELFDELNERDQVEEQIRHLLCLVENSRPTQCREFLQTVASYLPSAVILDSVSTRWFGADRVRDEFSMIPSAADQEGNSPDIAMMPALMSPETASEFVQDVLNDQIIAQFAERAKSRAASVSAYLNNLLGAFRRSPRVGPRPIQLTRGHCRFSLPLTVEQMMEARDTNNGIRNFLIECRGAV
jgi:hypothetical protein